MNSADHRSPAPMRFSRMPRDERFDASMALLANPYRFIRDECRRHGSDVFEARIFLQRTVCMTGPDAAQLFYDARHFQRHTAAPEPLTATLLGKGGVQGLDDDAHRHRKAMLMSLMGRDQVDELIGLFRQEYRQQITKWLGRDQVILYDEFQSMLMRVVCAWSGVPLPKGEESLRRRQLVSLFDWATAADLRHFRARLARLQAEKWLAAFIEEIRSAKHQPAPGTAAFEIAWHRGLDGQLLAPRIAAVELLNVLRPTVAVAVYLVFVAHALQEHPECRKPMEHDDGTYATAFVDEVRRCYPFFPAAVARARHDFEWNGYSFRQGSRALLDLYGTNHDPRCWQAAEQFRPERFLSHGPMPFCFMPQGGGDPHAHHRCAGEAITVELMKATAEFLTREVAWEVPRQDMRIDMSRAPALPKDPFMLRRVRLRG